MPGHFIFGINAALVQQRQQYTGEVDECRLKHLVRHRKVLVAILRRVEMRQGDAVGPVSPLPELTQMYLHLFLNCSTSVSKVAHF